jgi:hypothetical protein
MKDEQPNAKTRRRVGCVRPGTPGIPESGNEKARKGRKTEMHSQSMYSGDPKRSRPAPMLTGERVPGVPDAASG